MSETVNANSVKAKRYVAELAKGKPKRRAALAAGAPNLLAADKWANRASKNVQIQEAIEQALEAQGATAEYAVSVIKQVADQNDEIGAKRLAAKDILELHGWRKGETASVSVIAKNAFFGASRETIAKKVIEGEAVNS